MTVSSRLTGRELKILRLVAEGRSTADIALELGYSEITIKKVVQSILRGLGAKNRPHAVAVALRSGILEPEAYALDLP